MIKNALYSLFLHFILITLIYANFNLRDVPKIEVKEVSISLLEVKADQNANKEKPKEKPKKEKKAPKKKEKVKETPKQKKAKKELLDGKPEKAKKDKKKEVKKEEPKKEKPKKKKEKPKEKPKKEEKKLVEEEKPKEEDKKETKEVKEEEQNVNNLENINLSVREKFNLRSQLKMCYRRARAEYNLKESKFKITIIAEIAQDGFVYSNLEEITDEDKYKHDRDYKTAINVVERALNLCSPLRNLPADKYNIWKKVLLEFGENASKTTKEEKTKEK